MIKVKKFGDIYPYFKKQQEKYSKKIKQGGGYDHHLQAFTAQILWILLIYAVYIRITPIKDVLSSSALFFLLIGATKQILDHISDDIIPEYIEGILKGRFFYDFGSELLLKLIILFLIMNYLLFLVPLNVMQKLKKGINLW